MGGLNIRGGDYFLYSLDSRACIPSRYSKLEHFIFLGGLAVVAGVGGPVLEESGNLVRRLRMGIIRVILWLVALIDTH